MFRFWKLEAGNLVDSEWLDLESVLLNDLLFLFKSDGPIRWDIVGRTVRKMYMALRRYRSKRGVTDVDEALDGWIALAADVLRGAAAG